MPVQALQLSARTLLQAAAAALVAAGVRGVCDIIGGVAAWRAEVDASFPAC
jgi:rhodanese-related sulfurtransferase